jgi:hypothetical protein
MVSSRKCDPLLLISTLGHLNMVMMFKKMKRIVVSTIQSLIDVALTHLVRYFVAVIM